MIKFYLADEELDKPISYGVFELFYTVEGGSNDLVDLFKSMVTQKAFDIDM